MTAPDPHATYELDIAVQPDDIDVLDHVNNVVYLRWVQDVAVAHWMAAATDEEKTSLLWVVVRHEIDYKRPATGGDLITARTWVGEASHRVFERLTEIIRKRDGKVLARARTLWRPIDFATRQPVDVDERIYARFSTNHNAG